MRSACGLSPQGAKRVLRGLRGGEVSESIVGLTHLEVSSHALSPLVPLVPLVPLCDSRHSGRAQLITNNFFRKIFVFL